MAESGGADEAQPYNILFLTTDQTYAHAPHPQGYELPNRQRLEDADVHRGAVVASLAVSLDGYVAQSDGNVDFLQKYPLEDFDFDAFADTIGALIMGSVTYLQTLQWGWMWGDRPTTVLTTRAGLPIPDGADIRFSNSPTAAAIEAFSAATPKRLWVFGGGKVVTAGLIGGAIETLDITVMPEALGAGIPLFTEPYRGPMRLIDTTAYPNGAIRLVYSTTPD